jgi:hypothetical protein
MATTTCGYEAIRSGKVTLFYVNRDGLPLSDRCNGRMWAFCAEQYPKSEFIWLTFLSLKLSFYESICKPKLFFDKHVFLFNNKEFLFFCVNIIDNNWSCNICWKGIYNHQNLIFNLNCITWIGNPSTINFDRFQKKARSFNKLRL